MNTTVRMKASDISKDWHVVDATGKPLGRLATEVAVLLRGKHKPTFEPHLDGGDFVIVVNAAKVGLTGRKPDQKLYYRHSGYPGGLKSRSYPEQLEKFPDRVIEQAVKGMLPKGPLGDRIAKHLKVYRGPSHPHASQVTGSERAKSARDAAAQAALGTEKKPPRLRPLGGVVSSEGEEN
jgi:large subunit ribosomal protein L13